VNVGITCRSVGCNRSTASPVHYVGAVDCADDITHISRLRGGCSKVLDIGPLYRLCLENAEVLYICITGNKYVPSGL
jgi:hypothetical protein